METLSLRRFLAGAIFAALIGIACGVPLVGDHYFPTASLGEQATGMSATVMLLGFVVAHCNFMIVRGRPQWVRGLVLVFALCFLGVLPTITSYPNRVVYLFAPLLGLLLLNSKRHREMRERLVDIRKQRESLRRTLQKRR